MSLIKPEHYDAIKSNIMTIHHWHGYIIYQFATMIMNNLKSSKYEIIEYDLCIGIYSVALHMWIDINFRLLRSG